MRFAFFGDIVGRSGREAGHSRSPDPPQRITGCTGAAMGLSFAEPESASPSAHVTESETAFAPQAWPGTFRLN